MPIQILPPQLANQIAAGEVVERPASVVKELVENSLDAGATRIEVEIERGGSKRILIRDNGKGIGKDELTLALARHATSKVATLEELEGIRSFGFRGEALASISSVARLTLSSRTADASEAWQAYAEGREMAVQVQPTAHPVGTSVDVVDLFFNTPARRRFLKADKTEFTHIEEQLRRIALARDEIHIVLRHNGKTVRQYRPATNERQRQQRLAGICGTAFAQRAFSLVSSTEDLALHGYLALDDDKARVSEMQYFYVNGRVVRDRLVNHAVRQSLEEAGLSGQAGFVLYLSLDPHEVDVNVHPAKHEVRFHQARYVHDFILQALQQALAQRPSMDDELAPAEVPAAGEPVSYDGGYGASTAQPSAQTSQVSESYGTGGGDYHGRAGRSSGNSQPSGGSHGGGSYGGGSYGGGGHGAYQPRPLQPARDAARDPAAAASNYGRLFQSTEEASNPASQSDWHWLTRLGDDRGLVQKEQELRLVDLQAIARKLMQKQLLEQLPQGLKGQPLLLPVSLVPDVNWIAVLEQQQELLRRLGIEVVPQGKRLVIRTVPAVMRQGDLAKIVAELLQWLEGDTPENTALAAWLAKWHSDPAPGQPLWQQYVQQLESDTPLESLSQPLPWQHCLETNS